MTTRRTHWYNQLQLHRADAVVGHLTYTACVKCKTLRNKDTRLNAMIPRQILRWREVMHPEAENFQWFQTKVSSLDFRFPHITLSHSGCMPYSQKSVCQLSFGWLCTSSSSGSSVPFTQVRPVCLLEDSFSTQMSTTKTKLSSGLEHQTYLLNLRVSDLAFTRILHKICTIKYTSFNEKNSKIFREGACTLPPSVPQN